MSTPTTRALRGSLAYAALALVVIHVVGTIGFHVIADDKASAFDVFHVTFITVATIGDAETVIPRHGQTPVPILLQPLVDH